MTRIRIGNRRSIIVAILWAAVVGVSIADAQGGSAWSATGSLGLAPPVGRWYTDLDPGTEYRLSVSRWRPGSRWALAAELTRHSFTFADVELDRRDDGSVRGHLRQKCVSYCASLYLCARCVV